MNVFVFPQILVIIGLTHAMVVFRVIIAGILAAESWEFLNSFSSHGAMMMGAVFHYLIITVMTRVHRFLKVFLFVLSVIFAVTVICIFLCRSTGLSP